MEFSEVHAQYADDIAVTALSQRVPGLDYDDVVSEMTVCLWKAWQTFQHGRCGFGSYWWSLWLNRRSDIATAAYRMKRPQTVSLPDDYLPDGRYLMDLMPHPPTTTREGKLVWHLLALGEPVKDVIETVGLSRRGYYDLIRSWKTEDVWSSLRS